MRGCRKLSEIDKPPLKIPSRKKAEGKNAGVLPRKSDGNVILPPKGDAAKRFQVVPIGNRKSALKVTGLDPGKSSVPCVSHFPDVIFASISAAVGFVFCSDSPRKIDK